MKKSKTFDKWKQLDKDLNLIKEKYAKEALKRAHKILGDKMFTNFDIRYATLLNLQTDYHVALELAKFQSQILKENGGDV